MVSEKRSHVKFDDDFVQPIPTEVEAKSKKGVRSTDFSDSDSDSDDDVPEEEGLGNAKDEIESEIKNQIAAAEQEKQKLKEKRRKENERFKEQQIQKKLKDEGLRKKIDEFEKLQKEVTATDVGENDELEEMPEEVLENFNKIQEETIKTVPKHINFNEIDTKDYVPEIRQEIRKKKKNMLKKLRQMTVNKGVVKVSVLSSDPNSRKLAPKKEVNIIKTKDKWLKRRSLKKK